MKQAIEERLEKFSAAPAALSAAEPVNLPAQAIVHRNKLIKLIEQASRRWRKLDVFRDFVTMAACALGKLDLNQADRREEEYLRCARKYDKEEIALFPQMMSELVLGMTACPRDILGEAFMMMELGNSNRGQFFTPNEVCVVMAKLMLAEVTQEKIDKQGFITIQEPAAGGGATIIAAVEYLREKGINYQKCVHVTATDVDLVAAQMSFVQLALLHVPATVVHGNTLTLEEFDYWHTPAHIMGRWGHRIACRYADAQMNSYGLEEEEPGEASPTPM